MRPKRDIGMQQVTIRVELKLSPENHDFLLAEASARKLTFEGLLLSWIEERRQRHLDQALRERAPGSGRDRRR